jgi:hypothetical protein
MKIRTEETFFGEGISSEGETDPKAAFKSHVYDIRRMRLYNLLSSKQLYCVDDIQIRFEEIASEISKADKQSYDDNAEFINKYGIDFKVKEWRDILKKREVGKYPNLDHQDILRRTRNE